MIKNKIIVLGGVGRSGTTILSKLIGSCENVEFFYEPKTIDTLFSLIHEMREDHWKTIFKRNVYDELLINSLAGRNINTNKNDDSSIYNYKSKNEINERLNKSYGQQEIEPKAKDKVIAFKLLNNIVNARKAKQYIPSIESMLILRNPNDTLNSLMQKGWYSNDAMSIKSPEPASIFSMYKELRIPNFVSEDNFDKWINYSELERYGYYYIYMLENLKSFTNSNNLFIDYDDLINSSEKVLVKILNHFHLSRGEKTNEILSTIKIQDKKRNDLLEKLPLSMRNNIENLYNSFKPYTAIK